MPKRSSTGRLDLNQLAKHIVDQATGDAPKPPELTERMINSRKGGLSGGKVRYENLTAEQRSEIAKKAAAVRWKK